MHPAIYGHGIGPLIWKWKIPSKIQILKTHLFPNLSHLLKQWNVPFFEQRVSATSQDKAMFSAGRISTKWSNACLESADHFMAMLMQSVKLRERHVSNKKMVTNFLEVLEIQTLRFFFWRLFGSKTSVGEIWKVQPADEILRLSHVFFSNPPAQNT